MNILLVYPKYPDTFWSYKHALKFVSKKAAYPPLGLMTIAAMLPGSWNTKLIDMNVKNLNRKKILWADYIFVSAMVTQYKSVMEVIAACKALKKKIVAGGPLFTEDPDKFKSVDHLILNEAEITLPRFLDDLEKGKPRRVYRTESFANVEHSPVPDYTLIRHSDYSSKSIQYSRGCPFNCEFCDITALLGHKSRIKTTSQVIAELDNLYDTGWRGQVFFVDDNFIGNKKHLKKDLLPALARWMKEHGKPFFFTTEASINLADDPTLMTLMTQAGFSNVFVGIETTEIQSLEECNKVQNKNRSLLGSVKKIQQSGMEVLGGFIVGFDNDTSNVFDNQIRFIQQSGIISAMIGLLNAPPRSKLYKRLKKEGRIKESWSGDNTDSSTNIHTSMDFNELKSGYRKIIQGIYNGKPYYERIKNFLSHFNPVEKNRGKTNFTKIKALLKSMVIIGVIDKYRKYYWKLFFWTLFNRPELFPMAITYSIYGYHYRKVFRKIY